MPSHTGLVYHEHFLDHDTGQGHPERPDRLRALVQHLKKEKLWGGLQHLIIDQAPEEWILKVHTPEHLAFVRDSVRRGVTILDDADTRSEEHTSELQSHSF